MTYKSIAEISNIGMGLAIAGQGMGLANKKKITTKDMLKTGTGIIVGTEMLKINAANIASL